MYMQKPLFVIVDNVGLLPHQDCGFEGNLWGSLVYTSASSYWIPGDKESFGFKYICRPEIADLQES